METNEHEDAPFDDNDELFELLSSGMPQSRPLTEEFFSTYSGLPFACCTSCESPFADSHEPHLIQKVIRNAETVVELALCMACTQSVGQEMSEESRQSLEEFWHNLALDLDDADGCIACHQGFQDGYDAAVLVREGMILSDPIKICSDCVANVEGLLSEETRKGGQDFIDNILPGVPEDIPVPISFFS